ncbi:MAG: A/G-specific adenine glycosylase [Bacteroidota bacterium]
MKEKEKIFTDKLLQWHKSIDRKMPWKATKDPYKIWLSEIILQQTRVEQGTPYYLRFIKAFPNVKALAESDEDQVLKLWQGLGYYSRARNLHWTAKYIHKTFNGVFPSNYNDILNLKGVGPYTAAAIASFAFGLSYPVVDGNVFRVLTRYFGITDPIDGKKGKAKVQDLSEVLIKYCKPESYNQAIMDFGALQCTPKPKCDSCPIQTKCVAFKKGSVDKLPYKTKKLKKRNRYFHYLVLDLDGKVMLEKRNSRDIWKGLYEFPLIETAKAEVLNEEDIEQSLAKRKIELIGNVRISKAFKQTLSHQYIHARFYAIRASTKEKEGKILVERDKLDNFAVPKIINCYLVDNSVYLL